MTQISFLKSKIIFSGFAFGIVALVPSFVSAQTPPFGNSVSATISSSATVVQPFTVSATPLNFGTFVAGAGQGTVIITNLNSRLSTGDVVLIRRDNGSPSTVTVSGQLKDKFAIDLPREIPLFLAGSSVTTMTINAFTTNLPAAGGVISTSNGIETFQVGGTLNVARNQPVGEYRGSIPITITYE